ncbi:TPA: AAA family ATPase [Vibrio parahaemolyticus]|nr:AAA family ATPase [Vibrio parahaemolyticus]
MHVTFNLDYPHANEGNKCITVESGNVMFLVGANGTGKSSLMHLFGAQNPTKARRITAHRQVWFNSDSVDLTPASRQQTETTINNIDRQEQSRWKDDYAHQRSQVTIFDLIDFENVEARKIAEAARLGDMSAVESLAKNQAPIAQMNDILRLSNLNFQIQIDAGSKLSAIRDDYPPYSIAQLSDGERNALLIISNVLTAKPDSLILLDEPERHLHRSIVSPLISTLLTYRTDCAFIVSTHDVSLPLDQECSSVLLLRKYNHQPKAWEADFIPSLEELSLDETVASSILGARKIILFIEGTGSSLDIQLYQILYPNITIKTLGSCVEIERVVKGLRSSQSTHWVDAYGIVDRDNRGEEECLQLLQEGILSLEQYSIESLYYHPTVIRLILNRVALLNDIDPQQVYDGIVNSVISSVTSHKQRLAARLVQRKVKDALSRQAPDYRTIMQGNTDIEFSTGEFFEQESNYLDELLESKNIEKIISRYPVRETPVLGVISQGALFGSKEQYEKAVRKMLIDSPDALSAMRSLLMPVTEQVMGR